jgi:hypothetical protein
VAGCCDAVMNLRVSDAMWSTSLVVRLTDPYRPLVC